MRKRHTLSAVVAALVGMIFALSTAARGPGDTFTYQCQIKLGGTPFNGVADIIIRLYDVPVGGLPLDTNVFPSMPVTDGLVALDLDFGPGMFDGTDRWLEIEVDANVLAPRQAILPTPYAMYAASLGAGGLGPVYGAPIEFTNALNSFAGTGAGLTDLNASNIGSGTVPSSALSGTYTNVLNLQNYSNSIFGSFSGSGIGLTDLNWNSLVGVPAGFSDNIDDDTTYAAGAGLSLIGTTFSLAGHPHDAADITTGNFNPARLPTGGNWALGSDLSVDGGTLHIDQVNNRVGVGTTSPLWDFHVAGDLTADGDLRLYRTGGEHGFFIWRLPDEDRIHSFDAQAMSFATDTIPGQATVRLFIEPDGDIGAGTGIDPVLAQFHVNSDEAQDLFHVTDSDVSRFVVKDGGNVEIGTIGVTPNNARLRIDGTGAPHGLVLTGDNANSSGIRIDDGVVAWGIRNFAGDFILSVSDPGTETPFSIDQLAPSDSLLIDEMGRVGIGTPTPNAHLDVISDNRAIQATTSSDLLPTVYADHPASSEDKAAIEGNNEDTPYFGIGVRGDGGWVGVHGGATVSGTGVRIGVVGEAGNGTAGNYGVYGTTSGGPGVQYGVYSNGDMHVTGTLSKALGAFRIDHPLDPLNMELWHAFVESPDMLNIYNGNVVTDSDGYATVTMPDWFDALNRDFRYQLTVVDDADSDAFALAKVARELRAGAFTIRTSEPWTKVSWQVTGIRQDPVAEANRIPTVVEKRDEDRGLYLAPEAYGQPAERGVDWKRGQKGGKAG